MAITSASVSASLKQGCIVGAMTPKKPAPVVVIKHKKKIER